LGFFKENEKDEKLIENLFQLLFETGGDFTNIFRCLAHVIVPENSEKIHSEDPILEFIASQLMSFSSLLNQNSPKISERDFERMKMVYERNPGMLVMLGSSGKFFLEEMERRKKYENLKELKPEERLKDAKKKWGEWLHKYKERILLEIEGKEEIETFKRERIELMNSNNPKYILRNYLAQQAIEKAEKGDFSEVQRLHRLLKKPYEEQNDYADAKYDAVAPDWASDICVT